ncbi:hypothetical protein [Beggiatoa leptomitoformis]|uniref:DUF4407 domain-containing protein n=1 Tax=Beggiatoa leptomitoformis TaxID=288004 RepID=A0A2N9YCX2_9GAMM|nr:hypothetical protein [Beggiatoa leptomitoformis]AUI68309.1 hypothetical protein BLE401_06065 [Beggiatoa leptomitoformis]QGX03421.1 hypothetical protein AL038_18161 [Beggiatoa leptomitoformis]
MIITKLAFGVIAMLVSVYNSWLFVSFGAISLLPLVMAGIFVAVTEVSKVIFWGESLYQFRIGNGERATWTLIVALLLIALSVTATAFNLIVNSASQAEQVKQQSTQYQNLTTQLENVRSDVANIQGHKWFGDYKNNPNNAKKLDEQVATLLEREKRLAKEVEEFKPQVGSAVFWSSEVEMTFAFLRGLLLEVLGLMLIGTALVDMRMKGYRLPNRVVPKTVDTQLGMSISSENAGLAESTQLGMLPDSEEGKRESKGVEYWVDTLNKDTNWNVDSPIRGESSYMSLGMSQDKASQVKRTLKELRG